MTAFISSFTSAKLVNWLAGGGSGSGYWNIGDHFDDDFAGYDSGGEDDLIIKVDHLFCYFYIFSLSVR